MDEDCGECARWREKSSGFCAACGKKLGPLPETSGRIGLIHMLILLGMVAGSVVVLINSLYIALNFGEIVGKLQELGFSSSIGVHLGLWSYDFVTYRGMWIAVELAVLVIIQIGCLAYAVRRIMSVYRGNPRDGEGLIKTGLGAAVSLLCISMFITVFSAILTAVTSGTIPDTSWIDSYPTYLLAYLLTRAGVYEEFLFRVLWIGVPMALLAFAAHRDRRAPQYLLGGFGLTWTSWILIIVSAVMFGLAHNSGWGWSKIPGSIFAGVVFGYLFCEYGIYAAILAHTINDTVSAIQWIGLGLEMSALVNLALIGLGFVLLLYWIIHPNRDVIDFGNMERFPPRMENDIFESWKRH